MKLYADLTGRRTLQILSDVGVLAWVALWAWVGRAVHDATTRLAAPGYTLQGAGSGFRDQMARAGQSVSDVPLVGDSLAEPFQRAGNAGTSIEQAGKDLVERGRQPRAPARLGHRARADRARGLRLGRSPGPVHQTRHRRPALHRRGCRPGPVRPAGHGQAAHEPACPGVRRPCRGMAAQRPGDDPRTGRTRAARQRPATPACHCPRGLVLPGLPGRTTPSRAGSGDAGPPPADPTTPLRHPPGRRCGCP